MNMFEQATRTKLRFSTSAGFIGVEDLWDLPLTSTFNKPNLNSVAQNLYRELNAFADQVSFVEPTSAQRTAQQSTTQLAFDIVKHVIDVKVAERDTAKAAADRAKQRQHLLSILAEKEDAALRNASIDELRRQLAELSDTPVTTTVSEAV